MKEPHGEGPASHPDPEPCDGLREGAGEASVGAHAGEVSSPEMHIVQGADAVQSSGRQHQEARYRELFLDPAGSKTLCTRENSNPEAGRSRGRPMRMAQRAAWGRTESTIP